MKGLNGNEFAEWVKATDPMNPNKKVICPSCKGGYLNMEIRKLGDLDSQIVLISCPACENVIHYSVDGMQYPVTN